MAKASRNDRRLKRHARVRKDVFGTPEKPRLCVFRSNSNISDGGNKDAAKQVGKAVGEKAVAKGIKEVCFDRGGYLYHGRVKELADGAREAGLEF